MLTEAFTETADEGEGGRPRPAGRSRLVRADAGPGSSVAMAAQATRVGGFPAPEGTRNFIRWPDAGDRSIGRSVDAPVAEPSDR